MINLKEHFAMTRFIDVPSLGQLVNRVGMPEFFRGMVATMRADFSRWEEFDKCARLASHSDVGVIELMPAADAQRYAFKYVNGHPGNGRHGLTTVMAFGALADVETGLPVLLSELTLTTAFRTAAASVLAAQELARPDSRVMGIIGCGAQSDFQAIAFHHLLGIEEVRVFDIDPRATAKLVNNLAAFPGLKVTPVKSAQAAASGVDILTTVTADKNFATVVTADMLSPGLHINSVGGDCPGKTELHVDVLHAGHIFVEYEPQTRVEGDIQQLPEDYPVTELAWVIDGTADGRLHDKDVTIFDSVGFALEDFSALSYVNQLASEHDIGEVVSLVPDLADPRDLFALCAPQSPLQQTAVA
ncbi:MAG: ornithine cyclodeaminase [Halieaceae bacterium]